MAQLTRDASRRAAALMLLMLALVALPSLGRAQTTELTAADRLALLYSRQLSFSDTGEPVVRIGIVDGLDEVRFTAAAPIKVLPAGPGGPVIEMPAAQDYVVQLRDGRAGTYKYYLVLERFTPAEGEALAAAESLWRQRGIEATKLELGALFAISGAVFDNRESLLVSQPFDTTAEAEVTKKSIEEKHQVEVALHAELVQYPSAALTLARSAKDVVIHHQDLLWIQSGDHLITLKDVPTESGKKQDVALLEALVFTTDRHGKLAVVNVVGVETALRGVVPAEIFATAPLAALKVQAIAARGTLLSQIGVRHLADPYNLCNTQHCQVFAGMQAAKNATDQAVLESRGEVLFAGKRIAETYYSSNCGGLMASPEEVWGLPPRPYLYAHSDELPSASRQAPPTEEELARLLATTPKTFCNTTHYSSGKNLRWEKGFSSQEIDELVARRWPKLGAVQAIEVLERGVGGRVVKLAVTGTQGTEIIERELPVRRLFGGLRSGLFVVKTERDAKGKVSGFTFVGGGFGHGVGMCQTGCMEMARQGHSYTGILEHYYPNTDVKKLW